MTHLERLKPRGHLMRRKIAGLTGNTAGSVISIIVMIAFSFAILSSFSIDGVPTRAGSIPTGYIELTDLVAQGKITTSGGDFIVSGMIDVPSSTPLYVGPGERVLFHQDSGFKLHGPPIFDGTGDEPIILEQFTPGQHWKGLVVSESDPGTPSIFNNVTITGAEKGIWGMGADLKIIDCSIDDMNNSGLVLGGPLGASNTIDVTRTTISNATYYGISTQDLESLMVVDVDITGSGTGLRSVRSGVTASDITVENSISMGIYAFESVLNLDSFSISSTGANSTNIQVLTTDSDLTATHGVISGSRIGLKAIVGSNIYLSDVEVADCFKDGIQSDNSTIELFICSIRDNDESGIDLRESDFHISQTSLEDNGEGSGSFLFSTFYLAGCRGEIEGCDIEGSGYSHIHGVDSRIQIGNSTYDEGGVTGLTLDEITTITFINSHPPEGIEYLDMYSRIRYLVVQMLEVMNYTTEIGIPGAIVDIKDRTGAWIGSFQADGEGFVGPAVILAYSNTSDGSISFFPIDILVQSEGYEMLTMRLYYPIEFMEIDMYPPNLPPDLELYSPVNGEQFEEGTMEIEGSIQDDLGLYWIKVRIDSGGYQVFDLSDGFTGGNFLIEVPLINISTGTHELQVLGFDGVHDSPPVTRTVYVLNPAMADSDGDGLLDSFEDKNGNSIWDVDLGETDLNNPDTDGDGLTDGIELDTTDGWSTDPLDEDTDGDFILDGQEDQNGNGQVDEGETDPNNEDTDEDGVIDSKDKYPLDPERWTSSEEENNDLLMVLIMAVLLFILIVILAYLLFVKADIMGKGIRKREDVEGSDERGRPQVRRETGRRPESENRDGRVRRAPPRREGGQREFERKERGWR